MVDTVDDSELMAEEQASLVRRLGAEFLGTLLLVAVGAGAAMLSLQGPAGRLSTILESIREQGATPDVIEQQRGLFGNLVGGGVGEVLPVAFAFATILAVLVYALGGVSGAHFNPAVTLGLAVSRRFRWVELPLYWIFQCAGGIAGAFVIAGIYGDGGSSIGGTDILFGATVVGDGVTAWQAILAEAVIAFILMTAIMGVAVDPRAPKGWSGLVIGLALAGGILLTAAATGGSANFARSLGPFVASIFFEHDSIPWKDLLYYAGGPAIGAAAAALIYESVTGLERVAPAPEPGAATAPEGPAGMVAAEVTVEEPRDTVVPSALPDEEPITPPVPPEEAGLTDPGTEATRDQYGPPDTEEPPRPPAP